MPTVEEKVDTLKKALEDFVKYTGIEFNKVYNLQMQNEIDTKNFKDEMRVFKDEMGDFKDEMRNQTKEMNKKWGELANKMGTLVEDLVAPSIPKIVQEEYNIEVTDLIVRRTIKLKNGQRKEFDTVAIAGNYIFLNSTKSTLRNIDIDGFYNEIKLFRDIFPEYRDKKLIGVLASLYIDEGVTAYADKKGYYILGIGEDLMGVKNSKGFKAKVW